MKLAALHTIFVATTLSYTLIYGTDVSTGSREIRSIKYDCRPCKNGSFCCQSQKSVQKAISGNLFVETRVLPAKEDSFSQQKSSTPKLIACVSLLYALFVVFFSSVTAVLSSMTGSVDG